MPALSVDFRDGRGGELEVVGQELICFSSSSMNSMSRSLPGYFLNEAWPVYPMRSFEITPFFGRAGRCCPATSKRAPCRDGTCDLHS